MGNGAARPRVSICQLWCNIQIFCVQPFASDGHHPYRSPLSAASLHSTSPLTLSRQRSASRISAHREDVDRRLDQQRAAFRWERLWFVLVLAVMTLLVLLSALAPHHSVG